MLFLFLALSALGEAARVPAVSELNATMYAGRWYQTFADRVVMWTFERNAKCVTADYAIEEDPKHGTIIRLVNSEEKDGGKLSNVTGIAYFSGPGGELTVEFDPPVSAVGSYWVLDLGPVVDGLYQYAVVSDKLSQTMFVLARDVSEYFEKYDDQVQAFLSANGFTGLLYGPLKTEQGGECTYAPAADGSPAAAPEVTRRRYCPRSPAWIHASCDTTVYFSPGTECDKVASEIVGRVQGQYDAWSDPHNNGTYTLTAQTDSSLSLERTTENGKYTDKINFLFEAGLEGCVAYACSESQVMSILDFGTNHCNIKMLYCGTKDDCPFVLHDLSYAEFINSCSDSKTACF